MADSPESSGTAPVKRPQLGIGRRLMRLTRRAFLVICLGGLVAAVIQVYRPAHIDHLQPDANGGPPTPPRDLLGEMRKALTERNAPVEFSQEDLNRYLAATLQGELDLPFAGGHNGENPVRLLVEVRQDAADLHLDLVGARPRLTFMLSCEIDPQDGGFIVRMHRGKAGRMPLYGGLLVPSLPAFQGLAEAFAPELEALFRMQRIELTDSGVRLHPPPSGP